MSKERNRIGNSGRVCKFFNTTRGCRNGSSCKFQHLDDVRGYRSYSRNESQRGRGSNYRWERDDRGGRRLYGGRNNEQNWSSGWRRNKTNRWDEPNRRDDGRRKDGYYNNNRRRNNNYKRRWKKKKKNDGGEKRAVPDEKRKILEKEKERILNIIRTLPAGFKGDSPREMVEEEIERKKYTEEESWEEVAFEKQQLNYCDPRNTIINKITKVLETNIFPDTNKGALTVTLNKEIGNIQTFLDQLSPSSSGEIAGYKLSKNKHIAGEQEYVIIVGHRYFLAIDPLWKLQFENLPFSSFPKEIDYNNTVIFFLIELALVILKKPLTNFLQSVSNEATKEEEEEEEEIRKVTGGDDDDSSDSDDDDDDSDSDSEDVVEERKKRIGELRKRIEEVEKKKELEEKKKKIVEKKKKREGKK